MSAGLYWRPETVEPANRLGHTLRLAIEKYYGRDARVFTRSDLLFLRGFQVAFDTYSEPYRDAEILIEAIDCSENGVRVWIA